MSKFDFNRDLKPKRLRNTGLVGSQDGSRSKGRGFESRCRYILNESGFKVVQV